MDKSTRSLNEQKRCGTDKRNLDIIARCGAKENQRLIASHYLITQQMVSKIWNRWLNQFKEV